MASKQVQSEQKKALIIGISDYTDPDLPQLDFCKDDGRDMLKVLDSIDYNIYDKNKLIGRTKIEINNFFKAGKPEDILLFYYSDHLTVLVSATSKNRASISLFQRYQSFVLN